MGVSELVEVSFPVDMVMSSELGVVGSGKEDLDGLGEVDIVGPLVLIFFLAGWSLKGGESLFRVLVLFLVMGSSRPLGRSELGGRDHWAGGGVGWLGDTS